MYRSDGHPESKKNDICPVPNNRALLYGGIVRVGFKTLSHGLGTHKKVGHSGLPNSTRGLVPLIVVVWVSVTKSA